MRALLDSHALFWAVADSARLSETSRAIILDQSNAVFFSPVNLYEMMFKAARGRAPDAALKLLAGAESAGFEEAHVATGHFVHAATFDWAHGDPWDRLLLAQAVIDDFAIISADRIFDEVTERRIW